MKKITLTLLFLFLTMTGFSQLNEVVGSNLFGYRMSGVVDGTFNVVRTDEYGKVVWVKPMIVDNTIPFDKTQNDYIIYGFTQINNGKITGNPSDYDYWLVRSDTTYEVSVYPNPTSNTFYVSLSNYNEGIIINLYDITYRLVFNSQISEYVNYFQLPQLGDGTYIYEIKTKDKLIKSGKLCVLQN